MLKLADSELLGLLDASRLPAELKSSARMSRFGDSVAGFRLMVIGPAPVEKANTSMSVFCSITPLAFNCDPAGRTVAVAASLP